MSHPSMNTNLSLLLRKYVTLWIEQTRVAIRNLTSFAFAPTIWKKTTEKKPTLLSNVDCQLSVQRVYTWDISCDCSATLHAVCKHSLISIYRTKCGNGEGERERKTVREWIKMSEQVMNGGTFGHCFAASSQCRRINTTCIGRTF